MKDQELALRVHDAYESFGPTDEAQERVLASLRAAQANQTQTAARPAKRANPVLRLWWVALPVAACLVLAVVLVSTRAPQQAAPSASIATSSEYSKVESAQESAKVTPVAEEEDAAWEMDYEAESAAEAAPATAEPVVTLDDGTTLYVGEPVDEEPSWSKLEKATVWDGEQTRPCEVADRSYVRFEGDYVWYVLND